MACNISAGAQVGVMTGNQDTVLGGDKIKLYDVSPKVDSFFICLESFFRKIAGSTPVCHDDGRGAIQCRQQKLIAGTATSTQQGTAADNCKE